jgi:hypothetical protein
MGRGSRGKQFRRTVSAIPTGNFRRRLVAMAAHRGLAVIAVDPAYTSMWGGQHWLPSLRTSHSKSFGPKVTRHHAASVVIGRRSLGIGARRRAEKTNRNQRIAVGEPSPWPCADAKVVRKPGTREDAPHHREMGKTGSPDGLDRETRRPKTVRGRPPPSIGVKRDGQEIGSSNLPDPTN